MRPLCVPVCDVAHGMSVLVVLGLLWRSVLVRYDAHDLQIAPVLAGMLCCPSTDRSIIIAIPRACWFSGTSLFDQ